MEILSISCLVRHRQQTNADHESVRVVPMVEDNFTESSVAREVQERAQCDCVGEDGLLPAAR